MDKNSVNCHVAEWSTGKWSHGPPVDTALTKNKRYFTKILKFCGQNNQRNNLEKSSAKTCPADPVKS